MEWSSDPATEWSGDRLIDLAATLARTDYNVRQGEPHYGETEPWDAEPCHCDRPGLYVYHDHDGTEVRCWKCDACPATACRQ